MSKIAKLTKALLLIMTVVIIGCSSGSSDSTSNTSNNTTNNNVTPATTVSLTGVVVSSGQGRAKSNMVASRVGDGFKSAARGARKGERGAGVMAAQVQLYDANHPEWRAPVAATATNSTGGYSLTTLINASTNNNAYTDGGSIPAGLYTLYVTSRDPVSGNQMTFVSPHVQNLAGNVSYDDITVTTTTIAPQVVRVNGSDLLTARSAGVTIASNASIEVVFSAAMEPAAVRRMTVSFGGTTVSGTWLLNPDWRVATFAPTAALTQGTYQIGIPANVNDVWLNRLAVAESLVLTVTTPDTTAPRLVSTEPAMNAVMALGDPIVLYFNEQMDTFSIAGSIGSANPSRSIGAMPEVTPLGQIGGNYAYRITPANDLLPGSTYEVMITGGTTARDLAGNILMDSVLMTFDVAAAVGTNANTTAGGAVASVTQEAQVAQVAAAMEAAIRFNDVSAFVSGLHPDFLWQGVTLNPTATPDMPAAYDANQNGVLNRTEATNFFIYWFSSFQLDAPITANIGINWISVDSSGRYAQVGLDMSVTGFSGANLGPASSGPGMDNIILGLSFDPAAGWRLYDLWDVSPSGAAVMPTFQGYFSLNTPANLQQVAANGQIDLSWMPVAGAGSYLVWIGDMWGGSMLVEVPSTNASLTINTTTGGVTPLGGFDLTPNFPLLAATASTGRLNVVPGDELWWQVMAFSQASLATLTDATLFVTTQPMAFSDWFTFTYGAAQAASFSNVTVGAVDATGRVTITGFATPGSVNVDIFVYGMTSQYYTAQPDTTGYFQTTVFADPGFMNIIDMYDTRGAFFSSTVDASAVVGVTYVPTMLDINSVTLMNGATVATNGATSYALQIHVADTTGAAQAGVAVHVDAWGWTTRPFDVVTDINGNANVTIPLASGEYVWVDAFVGINGYVSVALDNSSTVLTPVAMAETEPNDITAMNTIDAAFQSIGAAFGTALSTTADIDRFNLITVNGGSYEVWTEIAANTPDTVLTIYDANGNMVVTNDDTFGLASMVAFTDNGMGPYVAEVRPFGGTVYTGAAYNLHSVNTGYVNRLSAPNMLELEPNDTTANQTLASGNVVGASIDPLMVGDADRFTINLLAGQTLVLDTEIGQGMDTTLELFDATATMSLAYNDDWNGLASHIEYVAPVAQTVIVEVRGFANVVTGNYNLMVTTVGGVIATGPSTYDIEPNDLAANPAQTVMAPTAGVPAVAPGSFATLWDNDIFLVNVVANNEYDFFTVLGTQYSPDTWMYIYDAAGNLLASNDDRTGLASGATLIIPAGVSQVFVHVSDYWGYGGSLVAAENAYELHVEHLRDLNAPATAYTEAEPNDSSAAATALTLPGTIAGTLQTNDPAYVIADNDWFVLNTTVGTVVSFSTRPTAAFNAAVAAGQLPNTDTVIEVWEMVNGVWTNTNYNDDFSGLWSQVTHTAQSSAVYVKVRAFANSIYTPLNNPLPGGDYELVVGATPLYKALRMANKAGFSKQQVLKSRMGAKVMKPSGKTRATKAFRQKLAGPAAGK